MPDTPVDRLPPFEMVTFSEPTGIPFDWDKELLSKGVPKDPLGRYNAAHELTLLGGSGLRTTGVLYQHEALRPHLPGPPHGRNRRHRLHAPQHRDLGAPGHFVGRPSLVNSSLDQFIASVRAVSERFPFYSRDFLESEVDRVAEDLTEILRSIDRAAVADETTFWWTFVFDVRMGDFATEDVLRDLGQ